MMPSDRDSFDAARRVRARQCSEGEVVAYELCLQLYGAVIVVCHAVHLVELAEICGKVIERHHVFAMLKAKYVSLQVERFAG